MPPDFIDGTGQNWETVSEGVKRMVFRVGPSENRVLLHMASGKAYPAYAVLKDFFAMDGNYVDPGGEGGKAFGLGSYLYYPAETEHHTTNPTGCTILIWKSNVPKKQEG